MKSAVSALRNTARRIALDKFPKGTLTPMQAQCYRDTLAPGDVQRYALTAHDEHFMSPRPA